MLGCGGWKSGKGFGGVEDTLWVTVLVDVGILTSNKAGPRWHAYPTLNACFTMILIELAGEQQMTEYLQHFLENLQ
jgi:hypothetical protein